MVKASDVLDLVSKMSPVLVNSVDEAISSAETSTQSVARALLDASDSDDGSDEIAEFLLSSLGPLIAGIALGVCVMVGYFMFVLVSCCCKCCNSNRGCCQQPQQIAYKQRLPFMAMVAIPALLGMIGGIMVLSAGPGLVKAFQGLIDALLQQFDDIVDLLRNIYDSGVEASQLSNQDSSALDPIKDLVDVLEKVRDEDIADYNDQAGSYFKLVQTISMLIGGGFITTGLMGIVAPVSMKKFLLVGFLVHTALLTSLPFILWGTLTFVGSAGTYICTEFDTVMAGGDSPLFKDSVCPDQAEIGENLGGPLESANEATGTLNDLFTDANEGAASAFSALQTECAGFDGPGNTYYDALCTAGNVDAQLLSSIYQCVDNEGIASFNINDALTSSSCTWHETNYPSVDFGAVSVEACFHTATDTVAQSGGDLRGIVAAATTEGGALLTEESFVRGVLNTLPLACEFNTGTNSIEFTADDPPVLPPMCEPFDTSGVLSVPTPVETCEELGQVPFEKFTEAFGDLKCTQDLTGADTDDNRKRCTIAGTPIFREDYETMENNARAITLFQGILTSLNLWASCQIYFNVMLAVQSNCHPIPNAAKKLASGMLLCGIGFTLAALMVCSCWRKLTKPKDSVVPYNPIK